MNFYVLASGSKGNACIIKTNEQTLLIDCGTTKGYLKTSMAKIGLVFEDVDAVLITHDHSDHTSQLKHFAHATIYSPSTHNYDSRKVIPYEGFVIDAVSVLPIKTSHDDADSVGYVLEINGEKLVYVTDTGYIRTQDFEYIQNADYYIFESNHDPEMLMLTPRPYYIKQRILSDEGHLSNEDAGLILAKAIGANTKQIVLAHLSGQANTEVLALETVRKHVPQLDIDIKAARQSEIVSGGHYDSNNSDWEN